MTITNIQQVGDHYTADVNGKTLTFQTDPSLLPQELIELMYAQVEEIRLSNLPNYIKELAKILPYQTGTDQEICDALNASTITKYTPVPVPKMLVALITVGVYSKLVDADRDVNSPDHAAAVSFLAILNRNEDLDFTLPAAQYLFSAFSSELAPAAALDYIKALGISMINWSTSIGHTGNITPSDIELARG